ncbi:membrane-associated HD superfamily phosphohydrolase [Enterococcus sp. PF1-24]|uniref:hypothetical protein n=1 Tax=unclassified Enterococcus TaxID=2608891 RepID=UPI0024751368|nr:MULTISPECIES: hypothetical protein [unclassified Enterococcus]MDH6363264.1 membrane-associated HD superfamily phosphohydrolase [Enterococcus sp. PFB1-1]MDH6400435.1 membrane-associated HD superfamily phosphohydrolase [Enterococcus sp. PF1-24]
MNNKKKYTHVEGNIDELAEVVYKLNVKYIDTKLTKKDSLKEKFKDPKTYLFLVLMFVVTFFISLAYIAVNELSEIEFGFMVNWVLAFFGIAIFSFCGFILTIRFETGFISFVNLVMLIPFIKLFGTNTTNFNKAYTIISVLALGFLVAMDSFIIWNYLLKAMKTAKNELTKDDYLKLITPVITFILGVITSKI